MQVKVQTVNELTINQLSEDQYKAEKEAGRIKSGEVYACTPSPVKWEDIQDKPDVSKNKVDFEELSRRIPSWQWKVTIPKSGGQTVTATIGTQTYTDDFYAPQGSQVAFSVKADDGYKAGVISLESATLTEDITVTVTDAVAIEKSSTGSISFPPEYFDNRDDFELEVPQGVRVLKLDTHLPSDENPSVLRDPVYFKVVPGTKMLWTGGLRKYSPTRFIVNVNHIKLDPVIIVSTVRYDYVREFTFYWSDEINGHATDIDLTELGNKWILKERGGKVLLVPDRFSVLKVEAGDKVKYVKLGEKRKLGVNMYISSGVNLYIENKNIFNNYDNAISKTCTVSWSDEIDTHAPDIEL